MASTTATFPGSATVAPVTGTSQWVDTAYISANDLGAATVYNQDGDGGCETSYYSEELRGYNFGFAIPSGATIDGIEVVVSAYTDAACAVPIEHVVQLVKTSGSRVGSNKATNSLTEYEVAYTFGGPTDLWGTTWTRAEINASTFGVALEYFLDANYATVYVNYVTIKVYYTEGSGSGSSGAGIGSRFFLLFT